MPATSDISVLITDDDASVRSCVAEIVAELGHRVFTAGSGTEALTVLRTERIGLTIFDVHLPDMTGFDIVETYRTGPWIAEARRAPARREVREVVPAIFMSGDATPQMHDDCRSRGWTLLDKPFGPDDMRRAIHRLLGVS